MKLSQVKSRINAGASYVPIYTTELCSQLDFFAFFRWLKTTYSHDPVYFYETNVDGIEGEPTYSLIGLNPREKLCVRNSKLEVTRAGATKVLDGEPHTALAAYLEQYKCQPVAELPFFQGGAFGYIGYDFVRHVEPRLKKTGYFQTLDNDSEQEVELFICQQTLIMDHTTKRVYIISGLFIDDQPQTDSLVDGLYKQAQHSMLALQQRIQEFQSRETKNRKEAPPRLTKEELPAIENLEASLGAEAFAAGVKRLKSHIRNGDIFQAVLAERFERKTKAAPIDVFAALRQVSPSPYRFYFEIEDRSYLGASPEILLKTRNGELETHPIAGTRPRGRDEKEDRQMERRLLASPKEKAEHLMLVDLARNDLGRIAVPGTVKVESYMDLKRYSTIMHLVSVVKAKSKDKFGAIEALSSCFPAGTLSGAPKIRAMELLSEIEKVPRGFYGGAVVAVSFTGDLDSCITIRSLEMAQGKAILRAGAGIVADSHPEREYMEVQHKLATTRLALAMAERKLRRAHVKKTKKVAV